MEPKAFTRDRLVMQIANLRCAKRTMIKLSASGKELEYVKRLIQQYRREQKELEK